jgi:hypothetical protein
MREASVKEIEAALSGPAVLANRFVLLPCPEGVRLSFLEVGGGMDGPHHRASVVLSKENVAALGLLAARVSEVKSQE